MSHTNTAHLALVHDTAPARPAARPPRDRSLRDAWNARVSANASDDELIGLAFEHCHEMVYAVALRITDSSWEAEDITQNVFVTLATKLSGLRDPRAIPGFLKTCTVRQALRHAKRRRWRNRRHALLVRMTPRTDDRDAPITSTAVAEVLAKLEPEERTAVILKFVESHSHEEVARLMGVSISTVRRRLVAARQRLASEGMGNVDQAVLQQIDE